ncbi:hypothetical protein ACN24K_13185 [Streptomyces microflavus]
MTGTPPARPGTDAGSDGGDDTGVTRPADEALTVRPSHRPGPAPT